MLARRTGWSLSAIGDLEVEEFIEWLGALKDLNEPHG